MGNKIKKKHPVDNTTSFDTSDEMFYSAVEQGSIVNKDAVGVYAGNKTKRSVLDLHGSSLEAACIRIENKIKSGRNTGLREFAIITGQGNHSHGTYSPLAVGIPQFLAENSSYLRIRYRKEERMYIICIER